MKIGGGFFSVLLVLLLQAPVPLPAQDAPAARVAVARSRLLDMAHAYHPEEAWDQALRSLAAAGEQARAAGDFSTAAEADLTRAAFLASPLGRTAEAEALLQALLDDPDTPSTAARAAYLHKAKRLARRGDEAAIRALIHRFRNSRHFDGTPLEYDGGRGPHDPLRVRRPHRPDGGSLTVASMERLLLSARSAPGKPCPPFSLQDRDGRTWSPVAMSGRVVLLDFWVGGSEPWRRDLPNMVALHRRYREQGFEILGLNLERDRRAWDGLLSQRGARWPQVEHGTQLAARLGIFGESTNLLINRHGIIVGRDLRGAELAEAVRRHVRQQP